MRLLCAIGAVTLLNSVNFNNFFFSSKKKNEIQFVAHPIIRSTHTHYWHIRICVSRALTRTTVTTEKHNWKPVSVFIILIQFLFMLNLCVIFFLFFSSLRIVYWNDLHLVCVSVSVQPLAHLKLCAWACIWVCERSNQYVVLVYGPKPTCELTCVPNRFGLWANFSCYSVWDCNARKLLDFLIKFRFKK